MNQSATLEKFETARRLFDVAKSFDVEHTTSQEQMVVETYKLVVNTYLQLNAEQRNKTYLPPEPHLCTLRLNNVDWCRTH